MGSADINGLEMDFAWAVTDRFAITAGASFLDSELTDNYCGFYDENLKPVSSANCARRDPETLMASGSASSSDILLVPAQFISERSLPTAPPPGGVRRAFTMTLVFGGRRPAYCRLVDAPNDPAPTEAPPRMADLSTDLIDLYDPTLPLEEARTCPASWYVDPRILELEQRTAFTRTWQYVCRLDQVRNPGQYVSFELAGEPLLVVRGNDGVLRGFFNVCRHHAAAVVTSFEGCVKRLQCPYHGWTYTLDGTLKAAPAFEGVRNFDPASNSLVPVATDEWENWVFVRLSTEGPSLEEFLGADLVTDVRALGLAKLRWMERRHYHFECNWKVFVDNYLDGGYHVPYLHKGLDSVLDYNKYTIANGRHHCLQSSPIVTRGADLETGAVRRGERALYYWIHPNFMINWYEGVMDTNLVYPRGVEQTEVIFDFWFEDVSEAALERNRASIAVGQRIQDEDTAICRSVQRGLRSRAYDTGRLSVRREAGVHLFHRLLHADLKAGAQHG